MSSPPDVVDSLVPGSEPLIVLDRLRGHLDGRGLGSGVLSAEAIGDGHSNATFLLRRDSWEAVLRRPPRGPLPPSAHDVLREATVIASLAGRAPVPRVIDRCDDESVIGAPFFLMERVPGCVVSSTIPAPLDSSAQRRRMAEQLVDGLVEVHAVDWKAAGLEAIGRPSGYLGRQLRRFTQLWEHNRTRELPVVEEVGAWLGAHLPVEAATTVVHGDYRLGNTIMAAEDPTTLVAILDWEMATLGDPLADVGYLLSLWSEPADPPFDFYEFSAVTRAKGFPGRAELAARYEERSGRSLRDLRWYRTLALWKSVVFMEGNYRRALEGRSDDPFLLGFGDGVAELAERARETALGAQSP
jgi:aminoglycoside phosphotransferase (APT) family kinase protein